MDMHDKTTAKKSFWARPEGKTGMLFAAAAIAGAGYGLYNILPFLITLFENTLYAGFLGGALLVLTSPIWNTTSRNLVSYIYRSTMRKITGFVIEMDPIGILKNYLQDLKKSYGSMEKAISNLRGQIEALKITIDTQGAEAQKSMRLTAAAQKKGAEARSALVINSRKTKRLESSSLTLKALLGKMEMVYKSLSKMREVAEITILDMDDEIRTKEIERNAILAGYGAFTSAMKVLKGNPDTKALYDQALEYLADDYAAKIGEIEDFMANSEGFIASIDLDNMTFEQEALERLEAMEKKSNELLGLDTPQSEEQLQDAVSALYMKR